MSQAIGHEQGKICFFTPRCRFTCFFQCRENLNIVDGKLVQILITFLVFFLRKKGLNQICS